MQVRWDAEPQQDRDLALRKCRCPGARGNAAMWKGTWCWVLETKHKVGAWPKECGRTPRSGLRAVPGKAQSTLGLWAQASGQVQRRRGFT